MPQGQGGLITKVQGAEENPSDRDVCVWNQRTL